VTIWNFRPGLSQKREIATLARGNNFHDLVCEKTLLTRKLSALSMRRWRRNLCFIIKV